MNFTTVEGASTLYSCWNGVGWEGCPKIRQITGARLQVLTSTSFYLSFLVEQLLGLGWCGWNCIDGNRGKRDAGSISRFQCSGATRKNIYLCCSPHLAMDGTAVFPKWPTLAPGLITDGVTRTLLSGSLTLSSCMSCLVCFTFCFIVRFDHTGVLGVSESVCVVDFQSSGMLPVFSITPNGSIYCIAWSETETWVYGSSRTP